jgi:Uma2 family endonuclease
MGNLATPEALLARWEEALEDPVLRDLPYKIELNSWGKLEMTPASNRHGHLQSEVAYELRRQLQGLVITECSVLTRIGVRVPDVAWCSPEFIKAFGEITPYTQAPEICVEILSPSNVEAEVVEKTAAYLAAGALEVWLVSEDGSVRYVGPAGDQPASRFPVTLTLPAPLKPAP